MRHAPLLCDLPAPTRERRENLIGTAFGMIPKKLLLYVYSSIV